MLNFSIGTFYKQNVGSNVSDHQETEQLSWVYVRMYVSDAIFIYLRTNYETA